MKWLCKPNHRGKHKVLSVNPKWQILRTGVGWTHLWEADDFLADLKSLYVKKLPGETVVISDTELIKCIDKSGLFTLTKFYKSMHNNSFNVKISFVKPIV
jgi:hypothetical protein